LTRTASNAPASSIRLDGSMRSDGRAVRPRELGDHRLAQIDADHLARLKAPLLLDDEAFDHRAFGQAAPVMLLEHREMDEDVALGLLADDEAEAAGGVEPFDRAGDMEQRLAGRCGTVQRAIGAVDMDGFRTRVGIAPGDRGMPLLCPRLLTRRHLRLTPLDQTVKLPRIATL
jgi:hypothetical protein